MSATGERGVVIDPGRPAAKRRSNSTCVRSGSERPPAVEERSIGMWPMACTNWSPSPLPMWPALPNLVERYNAITIAT